VTPLGTARHFARRALDKAQGYGVVNRGGRGVVGLIDVGSVGDLRSPWDERADLVGHLLKFEPCDAKGETPRVVTVDAALWSKPAKPPFYGYSGLAGSGSSRFKQNVDYVRENFDELRKLGPSSLAETWFERSTLARVEEIRCTTLDAVLADRSESYQVLKIDAQGAERPILQGQLSTLAAATTLPCTSNCSRYRFTKALHCGMRSKNSFDGMGFPLAKEFPPHRSFDSQNDCLYVRRGATRQSIDAIRTAYGL
jgi:FkbM family methyltransferase